MCFLIKKSFIQPAQLTKRMKYWLTESGSQRLLTRGCRTLQATTSYTKDVRNVAGERHYITLLNLPAVSTSVDGCESLLEVECNR